MGERLRPIGVDLGTTNTVASLYGEPIVLGEGGYRSAILPSVVAYLPDRGVEVGWPARARRVIDARNTIASAKRIIGERWGSYRFQRFREVFPYDFVETADGQVGFQTRAGVQDPRTVASTLLHHLLAHGKLAAPEVSVLVTVPASFDASGRDATLEAIAGAGFPEAHLIAEPVATAIAYLKRSSLKYGIVYDLGGGTFDLAVVDCTRFPFEVIGHGGDPYLGGDDVDRALAEHVADRTLEAYGWDLRSDREVYGRLMVAAERAKRELSEAEITTLDLADVDEAAPTQVSSVMLDRGVLDQVTRELIGRTFAVCDRVLSDAGLATKDIQAVFLAGGATLLPGLREQVEHYFGKRPRSDIDPMHVVSIGASLVAARPDLARAVHGMLGR
jgi:molecular chaperone DnaK